LGKDSLNRYVSYQDLPFGLTLLATDSLANGCK